MYTKRLLLRRVIIVGVVLLLVLGVRFAALPVAHVKAANEWTVCLAGPPTCDFATIQGAINAASPGDTILVSDGTYNSTTEGSPVPEGLIKVTQPLTIKAREDGNEIRPVIDGSGFNGIFKIWHSTFTGGEVVIEGFDLVGNASTGIAITAAMCDSANPTKIIIRDNLIHGMIAGIDLWGSDSFCTEAGEIARVENVEITDNEFYALGYDGVQQGAGVILEGLSSWSEAGDTFAAVIDGNVFRDIYDGTEWGVGIVVELPTTVAPGPANVQIANNKFLSHVGLGIFINSSDVNDAEIVYNSFSDSSMAGIIFDNIGSGIVDASKNWWGDVTGPNNADHPEYVGCGITDNVKYSPWLGFLPATVPMTWHVNTTGTIQEAVDAAANGDTIEAEAGTYPGSFIVNKSVTLLGPNALINPNTGARVPEAVLQGTTTSGLSQFVNIEAENVVIKGFTFDNLSIVNWDNNGRSTSAEPINGDVIENNYFKNISGTVIYLRDGRDAPGVYSTGVSVSNNKIDPITSAGGVDFNAGTGILLYGAEGATVNNNVIISAAYNGIQLGRDKDVTVSGNTATGAVQPALQIAQWNDGTNTISGNTFSTTSTTKAAIRLYGFTNSYYPLFNFTGNTIKDSVFGVQIGREDTGLNDIVNADYSFAGNTFTNINQYRLIVYLTAEATSAEVTEMDALFAQSYATGSTAKLITSATPWTYVVTTCTTDCYVAKTGSDMNIGTEALPFLTIQKGIDSVSPNGTVHVAAGDYSENITVDLPISIIGSGPGVTKISALTSPVVTVTSNDVAIKNLEVTDPVQLKEGLQVIGATQNLVLDTVDFTNLANGTTNAFGVNFKNSFTGLEIKISNFSGLTPGTATRAMAVYMPSPYLATDFEITGSSFTNVFTGVDIRGSVDGLTIFGNTFGPMDLVDCTLAASGIYLGDGPANLSIDDVLVSSNTFTSYCRGFYMWEYRDASTIGSVSVSGNSFTNSIYSSGIRMIAGMPGSADTTTMSGPVSIDDNTFTQSTPIINGAGVAMVDVRVLEPTSALSITNNEITFSGTFTESTYGIITRGPISQAVISGNILSGNAAGGSSTGLPSTTGVYIRTDDTSFGAIPADAVIDVTGNTITGFVNGISIQDARTGLYGGLPIGADLDINLNKITDNTIGIYSGDGEVTDATDNWWGSPCGPASGTVIGNVDYDPWAINETLTVFSDAPAPAIYTFPAGATADVMNPIIACAPNGSTFVFAGNTFGGIVVGPTKVGLKFNLNGMVIGSGTPAFQIFGDDIVVQGPGILDGLQGSGNNTTAAVEVYAGADNFRFLNVEVLNWQDGLELMGSVVSFKVVGNWFHDNTESGLQINSGVVLSGVITIEGNLFKENLGPGIQNDSGLLVETEYNSWGHYDGPTAGDGVSSLVDYDPWNFLEPYIDVIPDTDALVRTIGETETIDVKLKVDAQYLYGIAFKLTWDSAKLTLNSTTFSAPWNNVCTSLSSIAGETAYRCNLAYPTAEYTADGGTILTMNFTPKASGLTGNGPWEALFDIAHVETLTSAGAVGGVKIWVNNAGYGLPSIPDRDITDTNDGKLTIQGIANYTGFVRLEGRTDDSGAVLEVHSVSDKGTSEVLASATSASSGAYTTAHLTPNVITVGNVYYLFFDRELYLPTTIMAVDPNLPVLPLIPTDWAHSKLLSTRPLTPLNYLMLLGGDAVSDDVIDILDAGCIGNAYTVPTDQYAPRIPYAANCGGQGSSDVTGDTYTDMLDLVLMGGNYSWNYSPWTP